MKALKISNDTSVTNDEIFGAARGISADGSVIVGFLEKDEKTLAFQWSQDVGLEILNSLENGDGRSGFCQSISLDGSTIIGNIFNKLGTSITNSKAFKWSREKGFKHLEVPNFNGENIVKSISADGTIAVGYLKDTVPGGWELKKWPFIWTFEGIRRIGNSSDNSIFPQEALGISANGSVVVGSALKNHQSFAFKWTAHGGIQLLESIEGKPICYATAVNYDGSIIAGAVDKVEIPWGPFVSKTVKNHKRAVRWTPEKGIEVIEELLKKPNIPADKNQGTFKKFVTSILRGKSLLPSGWILTDVNAVTPSGVVFIGVGEYKGKTRAWRAVIPRPNLF